MGRGEFKLPPGVTIRTYLRPGDVDEVTRLHGALYSAEYGWDHTFEAYVAGPLSDFVRRNNDRERLWIVEKEGKVSGSIAIVEASNDEAQLRWFLVHPDLRGLGIGGFLMDEAIRFCIDKGYSKIFLRTEESLKAAARIYESAGFELSESKRHELWGVVVTEQRYELDLEEPRDVVG